MMKSFLITIDTEGDNQWIKQENVDTRNAEYLPRFQSLCEKYLLKPTYLSNWEMAHSPHFIDFGKDVLSRGVGEIGMHLHAWDMPPVFQLTRDDLEAKPYLIEYPDHVMRDKIAIMTDCLEDTFQCKMRSHRAGRWSFDARYAAFLLEKGYKVDCSVTPNVTWEHVKGDPLQKGGTDYSHFPETAYFMDISNIALPGTSDLLEVPMTVMRVGSNPFMSTIQQISNSSNMLKRVYNRLDPVLWLRPPWGKPRQMEKLVDSAIARQKDYIEFMIHSSELMPGGSPTCTNETSIEKLYDEIEELFQYGVKTFKGRTLYEYYQLRTQRKCDN